MSSKKLNARERKFVQAYLDTLCNAKAYRAINPKVSPASARQMGYLMRKRPHVNAEIERLFEEMLQETAEARYRVLHETKRLAYANIQDLQDEDGNLLPMHKWPKDAAAAVSSVEVTTRPGESEVLEVKKIKLWDKNSPRRDLLQYHGMLVDRKEVRTADDDPWLALMREINETGTQATQDTIDDDDDTP